MKTKILDVWIDKITPEEAVDKAVGFLKEDKPHTVFTPNPEFVMAARKNKEFRDVLNNADMLVPDGIGIVYASKLNKIKLTQRVTGYDLVLGIFNKIQKTNRTVYFLGGAPGIAEKAKEKLEKQYPGLSVVGTHDGFFDKSAENEILNDISTKKPDILLVGFNFVKQEMWIDKNKDNLPVKIFIGIGGAFDGYSGNVARAPVFFQKHGLEWLYRLIKQPSRFKRQLKLPLFVFVVVKEKIHGFFKRKK